ncbi:MAG: 50S ribosomal protein L25 [Candidatus Gracilibacteria bacterium]|nr:50S ribosomal protein L25 [Candidatus Gracilibacteria bacterium]
MENVALNVQPRKLEDDARSIRKLNLIPAVVYGSGSKNQHLQMDYQTFRRAFEKATYSTIMDITIEGGETLHVLVHDVQYHPVSDDIVHVDFYKVDMKKKVTTHLALDFTGVSQAVKEGNVLNTSKQELQISCLPGDLIHNIEIDISVLEKVGDSIQVSDVPAPKGIEILDAPEDTIISVVEPRIAEETETEGTLDTEDGEAPTEGEENAQDDEKKEE